MKITCPHCQKQFKRDQALLDKGPVDLEWYQFTPPPKSSCPHCLKGFKTDITPVGAILFLIWFGLAWVGNSFERPESPYLFGGVAALYVFITKTKIRKHSPTE